MSEMLNERGPFQVGLEPLLLKLPHPGDQKAYLVRVQFPEQRQPLCRLKVEITVDEPILTPVEIRPVLHGFAEEIDARIPVYSLTEITAEKLRALLQSKARLQERGWGASTIQRNFHAISSTCRRSISRGCAGLGIAYLNKNTEHCTRAEINRPTFSITV
jgi:hypothetical protein